eukprot:CAMPEP_0181351594 /NCGR_PEP_ID=MMETSP1106-20121128/1870_1 /TAXON_ID=81844 /ORGANISM="Mantoniella antarctica, Strain SL-175" /LENGTH=110 /DNA_ID=CAMNT_0023464119 /DNA_START=368 /DNA_END=700 /DNA_ORIENTATION=-
MTGTHPYAIALMCRRASPPVAPLGTMQNLAEVNARELLNKPPLTACPAKSSLACSTHSSKFVFIIRIRGWLHLKLLYIAPRSVPSHVGPTPARPCQNPSHRRLDPTASET